jgi:hypothetical protein
LRKLGSSAPDLKYRSIGMRDGQATAGRLENGSVPVEADVYAEYPASGR